MSFSEVVNELIYRIKDRVKAKDAYEAKVAAHTLIKSINECKLQGEVIPKAFIDFTIEFLYDAQSVCKGSSGFIEAFSGKNSELVEGERKNFEMRLQFICLVKGYKDYMSSKNSDITKLSKDDFERLAPKDDSLKTLTDFAYEFGQNQAAMNKKFCPERAREYLVASQGYDARLSDSKEKTLLVKELFDKSA